ncbi:hypothetical protein F444_14737 [Phytophthora nicotianae P1976]|uniref:Uncharacterized protein n=2 Tax=Phytophthora nicotianae TaxID=4792 RepID=A0A080ZP44_PHYNI|nr:hypothetical protein F444_14737 [Phytophthora nicotianae P1976]
MMLARPKVPLLTTQWLRQVSPIAEELLVIAKLPLQSQTDAKPLATVEFSLQLVVVKSCSCHYFH